MLHNPSRGINGGNMSSIVTIVFCFYIMSVTVNTAEGHTGFIGQRIMEDDSSCAVSVLTKSGWVCGTVHDSYYGNRFASFRGMPYAQPPLDELRFLAPQPLQPWDGYFDASIEGPVCPQTNFIFGSMMQPNGMGEDCLHLNVHVPAAALPRRHSSDTDTKRPPNSQCHRRCLPVLVFVHGGAFQSGSGDSDMYAPEYMMDKNVILVTLNYRLGVFGFLSLNSSSVPGNAGLRDMVAALQWVQTNARFFGGDPERVTLMGQSAGSSAAHLLSLSEATKGLFTNVILMSGTAGSGFYTTLPSYEQYVLNLFLGYLNMNTTNAEDLHSELIKLPYETILEANNKIVDTLGFSSFNPVVELEFDGVTRILDEDPDKLVASGRGNSYPLIVGYANVECRSMQRRLEALDVLALIQQSITTLLPGKLYFAISDEARVEAAERILNKYFNGTLSMENYLVYCSDLYIYPALELAQKRAMTGGAPVYLYQFSYNSDFVPAKLSFGLNYTGGGHLDDLSYVLRVNSILNNTELHIRDMSVKDWMTNMVSNFVHCSDPTCTGLDELWPKVADPLRYQDVRRARYAVTGLTSHQLDFIDLFDSLYQL